MTKVSPDTITHLDPNFQQHSYDQSNSFQPQAFGQAYAIAHPCDPQPGIIAQQPMDFQPLQSPVNAVIIQPAGNATGVWLSHICDCCVDGCCEGCCYGCCCAPCAVGENAGIVGWNPFCTGATFCILFSPAYLGFLLFGIPLIPLSCLIHAPLRRKLRVRYGINEACMWGEDWVFTTLFAPCAICQEVHETKAHGDRA
jgi:Cys-rich protein (TIGR01571 family)